jgi:hypothetical protein
VLIVAPQVAELIKVGALVPVKIFAPVFRDIGKSHARTFLAAEHPSQRRCG